MAHDDRKVISVPEAGQILNCGRNLAYELARQGRIPTIRLGRKLVVPVVALERMLTEAGKPDIGAGDVK